MESEDPPSKIDIHINTPYVFTPPFTIKELIEWVCKIKAVNEGAFEFSFVDKSTIQYINKKHLQHDYPTDTISFNLHSTTSPEADIYICIPVVEENAVTYNTTFASELALVMIHSILHTLGYNDQTPDEKIVMDNEQNRLFNLYQTHLHPQ